MVAKDKTLLQEESNVVVRGSTENPNCRERKTHRGSCQHNSSGQFLELPKNGGHGSGDESILPNLVLSSSSQEQQPPVGLFPPNPRSRFAVESPAFIHFLFLFRRCLISPAAASDMAVATVHLPHLLCRQQALLSFLRNQVLSLSLSPSLGSNIRLVRFMVLRRV